MKHTLSLHSKSVLFTLALTASALSLSACAPSSDVPARETLVVQESAALNDWFAARYEDDQAFLPPV